MGSGGGGGTRHKIHHLSLSLGKIKSGGGKVSRILNLPQYHLLLPCNRTRSYVQLSDIPSGRFPESIGQITPEDDLHDAVFATMSFVERI